MGHIVTNGNPTATGGIVIATDSTNMNMGKNIALHGDHATCGNCGPGSWPIIASANHMRFNGRAVVQHGDLVACPCGWNRVIATSEYMHYEKRGDGLGAHPGNRTSASALTAASQAAVYDQQFQLLDKNGSPVVAAIYRIVSASGVVTSGTTDAQGKTNRVVTPSAEALHIYLVN
jgi:uncharacterized Zn-binding protein involved in type VI secretion